MLRDALFIPTHLKKVGCDSKVSIIDVKYNKLCSLFPYVVKCISIYHKKLYAHIA